MRRERERKPRSGGAMTLVRIKRITMEITLMVMDPRACIVKKHSRSISFNRIRGVYIKCMAMFGNGPAHSMTKIMAGQNCDLSIKIPAALSIKIPAALWRCGAAAGTSSPRGCVPPTATGTRPRTATATWDSVSPDRYNPLFFILLPFTENPPCPPLPKGGTGSGYLLPPLQKGGRGDFAPDRTTPALRATPCMFEVW